MAPHAVEKGEWIGKIAHDAGFPAWQIVWDDPGNAPLRASRDPNLLFPGDELWIPPKDAKKDKETKLRVRVKTGKKNALVWYDKDRLRVRVVRVKEYIALYGPIPFQLTVGKEKLKGKISQDEQVLWLTLAPNVTTATLDLGGRVFTLEIGGLGPIEKIAGVQGRIDNLGWDVGPVDNVDGPRTKTGVKEFQSCAGIQADGVIEGPARSEAKKAYGC